MAITPISRHDVKPPYFDPWEPIDPPKENVARVPDEYRHDSIKEAKNAEDTWAFLYPEVAGTFLPPLHQASLDPTVSRPKLEVPNFDAKKLGGVNEEIGQLVEKIAKSDDASNPKQEKSVDKHLAEIAILQMYIQCMKTSKEHNQVDAEITSSLAKKAEEANALIKKDYFNTMDELIAQNKKSEVLDWVSWILYGALAVVGLASLVLTLTASVVTGGAALPLALTVTMALVNGVLSIAAGTTTIFKGVLDYNNKKTLGTLEEQKFQRHLNDMKIKAAIDEMARSMEAISEVWKELMKVVNNWTKASLEKPT